MGKATQVDNNVDRYAKLHSGGMRGIVILEVLRQIEEEFGRRIPIMNFFDLVVGTRSVMHVCSPRLLLSII
jgi:patatin-like phospholipase/acyl hydrolase